VAGNRAISDLGMVIEPAVGGQLADHRVGAISKYRRARLFVMTLGYCPKSDRQLVFPSSSGVWAELHVEAFRWLTGVTGAVPDNLREGVPSPDAYDPALNPLYRDVLRHYETVALPCRTADPDQKGRWNVASPMPRKRR
jgi:transposase